MVVEASKELYNQRRPNENLTSRPCHKNASEWLCQLVNRKNLNEGLGFKYTYWSFKSYCKNQFKNNLYCKKCFMNNIFMKR